MIDKRQDYRADTFFLNHTPRKIQYLTNFFLNFGSGCR